MSVVDVVRPRRFRGVLLALGLVVQVAPPRQFTENIRQGCDGQAKGTNLRARRELVPGTSVVYPINDYGAIQTGTHRFFGLEPGKPDKLRESGKFFHVWKQVDGEWKLARAFSFDHHPAE